MAIHLITGHAGTPHVTSDDQRNQNAILYGSGAYIVSGLGCTMANANTARIAAGDMMLNGAYVRVTSFVDVPVEAGTVGATRTDYICARYELDAQGIESVSIVCKKGANGGGVPSYTVGNILNGDAVAEFPMYSISIDGINIGSVVQVMDAFKPFGALAQKDSVDASDIKTGTIPVGRGGTGRTSIANITANLASTTAANALAGNIGVSGTLPAANGGTGRTSISNITANLASTTASNALAGNIGISGTLALGHGGTGATSASAARTNLGLSSGNQFVITSHKSDAGEVGAFRPTITIGTKSGYVPIGIVGVTTDHDFYERPTKWVLSSTSATTVSATSIYTGGNHSSVIITVYILWAKNNIVTA